MRSIGFCIRIWGLMYRILGRAVLPWHGGPSLGQADRHVAWSMWPYITTTAVATAVATAVTTAVATAATAVATAAVHPPDSTTASQPRPTTTKPRPTTTQPPPTTTPPPHHPTPYYR